MITADLSRPFFRFKAEEAPLYMSTLAPPKHATMIYSALGGLITGASRSVLKRWSCKPCQTNLVSRVLCQYHSSYRNFAERQPNHTSKPQSSWLARARSSGSEPSPESVSTGQAVYDGMPKLLIFGGNGFVGSRVCEEAVLTGLQIVSINRSGRPKRNAPWMDQVDWIAADAFDVAKWKSQLEGAIGVVSCIGAFGNNDFMFKVCGESNATVFREAAAAGVERAAFISVADYKLPDWVLSGYFRGKRYAEQVLQDTFPEGGVALRPGFMHGTRHVGGVGIPLSAVGWPLEKVLSYVPTQELAKYPLLTLGFIPPVSVEAVAKAAVAAATDSSVPAGNLDVWSLQKFEAST